jgi:hypothetical protein
LSSPFDAVALGNNQSSADSELCNAASSVMNAND